MNSDRFESFEHKYERIRREAADWIILEDRGFTPEEQDALSEWMAEEPMHAEAYRQLAILWGKFRNLKMPGAFEARVAEPTLVKATARHKIAPLLTLAAALAIGTFFWVSMDFKENPGVRLLAQGTGAQGYERHTLEDGSVVELNKGAQVSVQFSKELRSVSLLSGEAHFTVSKDVKRPFLVGAGTTTIKAVGTAFNVNLGAESVEVIVTEGRVRLEAMEHHQSAAIPNPEEPGYFELSEGESASVPMIGVVEAEPRPETVSKSDLEKRLEWKSPLIHFSAKPLSEVVSEFNRYNDTQLLIKDSKIANRSITAALRMNNLQGFLDLLAAGMEIEARKVSTNEIVLQSR